MKKEKPVPIEIEGSRAYGAPTILVQQHDNLIAHTPWHEAGYTVAPFLETEDEFIKMRDGLRQIFREGMRREGLTISSDFPVEQYHYLVQENQALHLRVMQHTKLVHVQDFPIDIQTIVDRVSDLVGVPLKAHNPQTNEEVFHLRIVRPNRTDFNPLHRDVWLDELRDGVNIYVPIAGSTAKSSLPLIPGSHYWAESEVEHTLEGAIMDGAQYNVPGLTDAKHELELIRPNPSFNEVLVFSPYLIHGGAANLNSDQTRVSLEMRFWRK